ncbi:hypothetical protein ACFVYG_34075 [Streptomyces sp. NPDC058256]|uniref:hypothetical protein n=1 Tax=Streptomyces sp. NPDC058256 TaxID=3346408 RepID=UPI0036EEE0F7
MAEREPNAHQFMDLEVPEYAYMFGFLQADGHLAKGPGQKGRLTAEINARDIGILREFQRLTPYNSSIRERTRSTNFAKTSRTAIWTLCSLEARTKLNQLGLPYGRKSETIAPPLGEFSGRDYLRGVIDADGSVGYAAQGHPFISLTTASAAVGAHLCSYARKITGAERKPRRNQRDDIYNINYIARAAQALIGHLYYPGCLALKRKQVTADSVAHWVCPTATTPRRPRIQWTPEKDRILLAAPTIASAVGQLKCSSNACEVRRWRLLHGVIPLPD